MEINVMLLSFNMESFDYEITYETNTNKDIQFTTIINNLFITNYLIIIYNKITNLLLTPVINNKKY